MLLRGMEIWLQFISVCRMYYMTRLPSQAQRFLTDIQNPDVHRFNSYKNNCKQDSGTGVGTGGLCTELSLKKWLLYLHPISTRNINNFTIICIAHANFWQWPSSHFIFYKLSWENKFFTSLISSWDIESSIFKTIVIGALRIPKTDSFPVFFSRAHKITCGFNHLLESNWWI